MKRILSLLLFTSLLIITSFFLFSGIESSAEEWIGSPNSIWSYSLVSFILLTSDVVLPVPSSLLMILNGKVLGIFLGSCLSILAGMTASSIGFYLGLRFTNLVNKFFNGKDIKSGNEFFNRYGVLSIAVSKFIPVLSESVAFISGCSGMSLKRFLLYSFIGHLLVSFTYAVIGHFTILYNFSLLAGVVISTALVATWIVKMIMQKR